MRMSGVILATLILQLTACTVAAQNLLANPGFDRLDLEGAPTNWDLFVLPGNNALGQADRVAHDGDFAITLKTPTPYESEPLNNWSQIIFDDLRGKVLTLSGSVRTQSAGNAGLWIQCFSRDRRKPLSDAASIQEYPLTGTHGWTAISTSITPPAETDYIMVRCFLMGTGQAWFDSLSLTSTDPAIADEWEELTPNADSLPSDTPPGADEPAIDPRDIIAVSQAMQQTIRDLEQTNRELMERIADIQESMDTSRVELDALTADTLSIEPAHPLVPYDFSKDRNPG